MLTGKRALVTGGTSGLGKAIAELFADRGAAVAIMGTNSERADGVLTTLQQVAPEQDHKAIVCDVSNTASVKGEIDALLAAWDGIDIVVNCAGITRDTLLMKMSEEEWDSVLDTNLKSVFNVCRAVVRPMSRARSGSIINIGSVIGLTGNPGQVNYAASKLGVVGLTKSLAKELGARGIRVNCIAPGFFVTPMTDALSEQQKEGLLATIPLKRFGEAKELAETALFLASSLSNYITGQVIAVDGGMLA